MKIGILIVACVICVFCVVFFLKNPFQTPKEDLPKGGYISVVCNGQLGNQLFKIASTLAYAWDHGLTPTFPSLNNPGDNLNYNRDRIFKGLSTEESPVNLMRYQLPVLNYTKLPEMRNVLMEGGFFSYLYFHHHRDRLQDVFLPTDVLDKLANIYNDLISNEKTVSIHVRTYSKITHDTGLHFVGLQYFEDAMRHFPDDSVFVVFTDRVHWTKHHFKERFPDRTFVFVEGNDHIEDMVLMSKMRHNILSNSTYSWWAAYLNQNPDKVVVHPVLKRTWWREFKKMMRPIVNVFRNNPPLVFRDDEYYLPEWQAVEYEVEPYPEDIYKFSDESKSVFKDDK